MRSNKNFNWGPGLFIIIYHILLFITLPIYLYYAHIQWSTIIASVVLLYVTGISITGGYHRFYAHRTYKTNTFIEGVVLFFASMAGQGSALRWAYDHRLHHAHVDTDKDPYSIKKGFLYAHMLWLFEKPNEIDSKVVPDLLKNKLVMFQHRFVGSCMIVTNAIAFLFVGWLLNDYWGAFFLALWTRLFTLHHFTWFINSLAHTWGEKPFSEEHSAVDNYFLSMVTFGEGYHNYHHTFANDYRNGIKWYHFDPTKWVIWTLSKLRLIHSLKVTDPFTIKRKIVLEKKDMMLDQIKKLFSDKKEVLEKEVQELSDRIVAKMSEFAKLKEKYWNCKNSNVEKQVLYMLKQELKQLKKSIKSDWKYWSNLSRHIRHLTAQTA